MRARPQTSWIPRMAGTIAAVLHLCLATTVQGVAGEDSKDLQGDAPRPVIRTAEEEVIKIEVAVDRDRVATGERVALSVRLWSFVPLDEMEPLYKDIIGLFDIVEMTEPEPVCGDWPHCREWVYVISCLLEGETEIPGVSLALQREAPAIGDAPPPEPRTLSTEAIPITVTSTLADVRGPATLPMPFTYVILLWIAGVIVAMALVALLVRWLRREKKPQEETEEAIVPHEWALDALNKLAALRLVEQGQIQEYYYRVNALLRRYIELRFDLMAGEQTSEEFIRALQVSHELRADHKEVLQRFVKACDPVKYARYIPAPDEIEWVQASAREFVLQTSTAVAEEELQEANA